MASLTCSICEFAVCDGQSPRCTTCKRLIKQALNTGVGTGRTSIPSAIAVVAIRESFLLHRALYPNAGHGYACHYSHIQLETNPALSFQGDYTSFDHTTPNHAGRAVLCSRIANDIKGWMTDTEFLAFVTAIIDLHAPRKIHGLTIKESRRFLTSLRNVMNSNSILGDDLQSIKTLSARIPYRKIVATHGLLAETGSCNSSNGFPAPDP